MYFKTFVFENMHNKKVFTNEHEYEEILQKN